jgi:hypothetical protein
MHDPPSSGRDRAEVGVTAASQSNAFAADGILLGSKFQGHEGGSVEVCKGGCQGVQPLGANKERDVAETEGLCVGNSASVFAWAKEKEEG